MCGVFSLPEADAADAADGFAPAEPGGSVSEDDGNAEGDAGWFTELHEL